MDHPLQRVAIFGEDDRRLTGPVHGGDGQVVPLVLLEEADRDPAHRRTAGGGLPVVEDRHGRHPITGSPIILSRTLVPTMAKYLMKSHHHERSPHTADA